MEARFVPKVQREGVTLALYPGDTLTQARALYADPDRVQGLLGLREQAWQLRPNFHFSFMEKGSIWTTSALDVEAYTAYWMERIHHLHAYPLLGKPDGLNIYPSPSRSMLRSSAGRTEPTGLR